MSISYKYDSRLHVSLNYAKIKLMERNEWVTAPIETATVEHRDHRMRRFMNKLFPKIVSPPEERIPDDFQVGDRLIMPNGRKIPIDLHVRSAEGVRYYGSSLPLPGFESEQSQVNKPSEQQQE